jgi:RHS repeat-associated protein
MNKHRLIAAIALYLVFALTHTATQAQSVPVCDSGGVCGTDPNQTNNPSYGGLLAARPMKQNARGSQNPMMVLPGWPGLVPRLPGSQSYNKAIPILHLPGRGIDLDLALYYNSRIWIVDTVNSTISLNPDRDFPSYGFRLDFGFMEYDQRNAQFVLTESDGTKHSMPLTANTNGTIFDSNDGTFIEFNKQTLVLIYKNGKKVKYQPFPSQAALFRPIQIEDRNGNFISIAYKSGTGNDQHIDSITDTLGRVIQFVYDANNHLSQITQAVSTATDQSATHVWATFAWASPPATLTYSFSGLAVVSTPASGSQFPALVSCIYPNQTSYKFSYGAWGIVNRIDLLSSTGQIRSYESYNFPDAAQSLSDAPRYTTMTVSPDGTSTSAWTYATSQSAVGQVTRETVTDLLNTSNIISLNTDGTPASAQIKDGNGKVFRTFAYTWKPVGASPMIASILSTDDAGNQSTLSYKYDNFGNVTDLAEGDFGNSVIRHTLTSYMGAPFTTNHILDLPHSIQITDGQSGVHSRTVYNYDETAPAPLGAVTHNDANISTPRGNQTSITRYADAVTPDGAITRNFTYDSAGNTITAEVDCCNKKKFIFDPATKYAYLSSEVRGPDNGQQFTIQYVFNPDNGLAISTTDENSQTTSYERDGTYRLKITHLPPSNGTPVSQTITYADDLVAPTITTSMSANSAVAIETYDGLGHLTRKDLKDSSTGNLLSTSQIQYDEIWRPKATSNPFAPGEPLLWTNVTYDPLNRTTLISPPSGGGTRFDFVGNTVTTTDPAGKQKKNFFDSLSRLVRVDEPGWGDALKAIDSAGISGDHDRTKTITTITRQKCPVGEIDCQPIVTTTTTIYDSGIATISINGVNYSYNYGQADTASTVATNLASKINADGARVVDASPSGGTLNFYARVAGASGNSISVSASSATSDPNNFGAGTTSFPASTFTPTLTGGDNAVTQDNAVLTAIRHLTTTYTYDVNDQLRAVSQGAIGPINGQQLPGQPRSYAYDDLRRLTSTTTPESGTVTNYYTKADGTTCSGDPSLVCRVVDARSITKTFSYADSGNVPDPLNRLRGLTYNDGTPSVAYSYDTGGQAVFALGRLTQLTDNGNSQAFGYDNLGRVTSVTHTIDGTQYAVGYAYNAADQITAIMYPSNRVINQTYDAVGRLKQIADASASNPYLTLSSSAFTAAGQVKSLVFGNGVNGAFAYNDHLQISTLRYFNPSAPSGTPDILNLAYDYGTSNNGQIQSVHYYNSPNVEDTAKSESFTYDPWARLAAAQTLRVDSTAGTWSLQWGYDRLGNRLQQKLAGGNISIGLPTFTIDESTNRIMGFTYDYAGNLTHDATASYTYDGARRLTGINGSAALYTYLGELRIKKVSGGLATVYIYSGNKPIAEYVSGQVSKEYVYADEQLLATVSPTGTVFHHPDHLSNRAETDMSGASVRNFGHFPYGESWYDTAPAKRDFTTYERDLGTGETGLDYAQFRFYSPGLGRFMSADYLAGNMESAQSLNLFAYGDNDPVNVTDPLGLENDCGGPCIDFTVPGTNGCVIVTYTQITSELDGKKYDMPEIISLCIPSQGNIFGPGAFAGQFGGGLFKLRLIKMLNSPLTQCLNQAASDFNTQMAAAGVKEVTDPDVRNFNVQSQFGMKGGMSQTVTIGGIIIWGGIGYATGGVGGAAAGGTKGGIVSAGIRSGYALAKTESVPKFFSDATSATNDYNKAVTACHAKYGN